MVGEIRVCAKMVMRYFIAVDGYQASVRSSNDRDVVAVICGGEPPELGETVRVKDGKVIERGPTPGETP